MGHTDTFSPPIEFRQPELQVTHEERKALKSSLSFNPIAVKTCGAQRLFLQGDVLDYNLELRQVKSPPEDFSGCAKRMQWLAWVIPDLTDFVCCCCCYCHFHFLFRS